MYQYTAAADVAGNRALNQLAARLQTIGWAVTLFSPPDKWPYAHVTNPYMRALNDDIAAAPDVDGRWLFWWSWGQPISHVNDIEGAAARICQVLALPAR